MNVYETAKRLILAATGEEYGDGIIVSDLICGYAEPGYGSDEAVVVTGDWNPIHVPGVTRPRHDDETLPDRWTSKDNRVTMPGRLAAALERIGAEIQWSDEWTHCEGCFRAIRTSADSYAWKPSYADTDDGRYCHECMIDCGEDGFEGYLNDSQKCLTWCSPAHVMSFGYVKWEPGNEQTYENGWHPGQDDTPEPILEAILEAHPDASVVFFLDEASQFYVTFSAYVKFATEE